METTCQIEGCGEPVFVKSRGWCRKHYNRWYKTGDPFQAAYERASGTPIERWWAKVSKDPDGHWRWTGGLDRHGYGQFDVTDERGHRNHRAHRWGYQRLVRVLDDTETLDHLCRVHECVNPEHLEPVSHAENVARGESGQHNAVKTHCPQGHEYSPENTRYPKRGGRECIECSRKSSREAQRRRRGTASDAVSNGKKTHCAQGHEYTPENTRIVGRGRECIACRLHWMATYAERKLAERG